MILIIGNIEVYYSVLLAFFIELHKRNFEAVIFKVVVRLYTFLSTINKALLLYPASCSYGVREALPGFKT